MTVELELVEALKNVAEFLLVLYTALNMPGFRVTLSTWKNV